MPTSSPSLKDIDPREWDRLAGENAFAAHGWLFTVEQCSRSKVEPLYFLHREHGAAVASAVCYVVSRAGDVETLDHMIYGRATNMARTLGLSFLPALVCGPARGYGWHIGIDAALTDMEGDRVRAILIDAMEAAARDRHLQPSFVHVMDHERELVRHLRERGYLRGRNVPVAALDVRWSTFDAYLDHLPQRARQRRSHASRLRTHYAHLPLADRLIRASGLERLHLLFNSVNQNQFHWGFERTRERYRTAGPRRAS